MIRSGSRLAKCTGTALLQTAQAASCGVSFSCGCQSVQDGIGLEKFSSGQHLPSDDAYRLLIMFMP
jgi:hypothetical protein